MIVTKFQVQGQINDGSMWSIAFDKIEQLVTSTPPKAQQWIKLFSHKEKRKIKTVDLVVGDGI